MQDHSQAAMDSLMNGEDVDFDTLFAPINDALMETQEEVTNEDVKPAVDTFASAMNDMTEELSDLGIPIIADFDPTDPEAIDQAEELQTQTTELQIAMQAHTEAIQSATMEVAEVCDF